MRRPLFVVTIGCTIAFLLSATDAGAQQASGIAGVVRDASGAVLPGITVEAASTALIEKTSSAAQRLRVQGNVDVYNALNSSSILTIGTAYGSRWRQPTAIVDPRIVQFSAMLTF
jgi:hypothetical protein